MDPDFDDMFCDELDAMDDFNDDNARVAPSAEKKSKPLHILEGSQTLVSSQISNTDNCPREIDQHTSANEDANSANGQATSANGEANSANGVANCSSTNGVAVFDLISANEPSQLDAQDSSSEHCKRHLSDNSTDIPSSKRLRMLEEDLGFVGNELPEFSVGKQTASVATVTKRVKGRVFTRAPYGNFVKMTDVRGERCYLKMKSGRQHQKDVDTCTDDDSSSVNHLSTSIEEMRNENNAKVMARLMAIADAAEHRTHEEVEGHTNGRQDGGGDNSIEESTTSLWVDKYSPGCYAHLLSDEAVNRLVLKWIKLWDLAVFNFKPSKPKSSASSAPKSSYKSFAANNSSSATKTFKPKVSSWTLNPELDTNSCPAQKVVLLNGAPGLGKTTLAYIVARHAGYQVVEINASDDRSLAVFKQRVDSATQMTAALDSQGRPNCLVIDEIDGAPSATVNHLLSVIGATGVEVVGTRRRGRAVLRRPILCICNNLYAPALRGLRQKALIVNVPATCTHKLANRLMHISRNEQMKCDLSSMIAFSDKSECDIRACLNTLQFMKCKGQQMTMTYIQNLAIGSKNNDKGLLSAWKSIFTIPKGQKRKQINPHDVKPGELLNKTKLPLQVEKSRFDVIYDLASSSGDSERLMSGCFENYLQVASKDRYMKAICQCTDWLIFCDKASTLVHRTQNYSLLTTNTYAPIVFNLHFGSIHSSKVVFPRHINECRQKSIKHTQSLNDILSEFNISVRGSLNTQIVNLTLLPYLSIIMRPSLRPVNVQLFSPGEKKQLSHLVGIMLDYNFTFVQRRDERDQVLFFLEPEIEDIINFDCETKNSAINKLSYPTKQLIASEIETERIRIRGAKLMPTAPSAPSVPAPSRNSPSESSSSNFGQHQSIARSQLKTTMTANKPILIVDKPVLDFFGRKVIVTSSQENECQKNVPKYQSDIWYRFKEGYTNAVRKPVKISEIIDL